MTPQRKRMWLGVALLATVGLVWLAPEDPAVVSAGGASRANKPRAGAAAPARTASGSVALSAQPRANPSGERASLRLREREPTDEILNLFRASTWYLPPPPPPPAPPAPPPPPPAPVTPPLPFTYMGQLVEDGKALYILARADRVVTVQVGDTIDKTYRLESAAGGVLSFVYVPLGTKQTLATGVSP